MIFKYYSYDKVSKSWIDTKNYISICPNVFKLERVNTFAKTLHNLLSERKLISMPYEYFAISDYSNKYRKLYTLQNFMNNKRFNFAKLYQLPQKENANVFGMGKNPFNDIKLTSFSTRRTHEPLFVEDHDYLIRPSESWGRLTSTYGAPTMSFRLQHQPVQAAAAEVPAAAPIE